MLVSCIHLTQVQISHLGSSHATPLHLLLCVLPLLYKLISGQFEDRSNPCYAASVMLGRPYGLGRVTFLTNDLMLPVTFPSLIS